MKWVPCLSIYRLWTERPHGGAWRRQFTHVYVQVPDQGKSQEQGARPH